MGPRFADQQVAGKHLGLLLSEMSALTRPLSDARSGLPYWGRGETGVSASGARADAPQGAASCPTTNFNSKAMAAAA